MKDNCARAVRECRNAIALVRGLRYAAILSCVWLFLWGAAVLILRLVMGFPEKLLAWGLVGVPVAVAAAIIQGIREAPDPDKVRAVLDSRNQCGGLLVADGEMNVGPWREKISDLSRPRIKWHGRNTMWTLLAACVFAGTAFLVPRYSVSMETSNQLEVGDLVEHLDTKIEILEDLEIIEESRSDDLRKKLADVWADAAGDDPVKTLEALDHIEEALSEAAEAAAEHAISQAEQLAAMESLANALAEQAKSGNMDKAFSEALKELAALMNGLELDEDLLKQMNQTLKDIGKGLNLTPEQLAELAKYLRECKGDIRYALAKMCKGSLIDADMLSLCENALACNDAELAAFLEKNCDAAGFAVLACQLPGRGGVTRGRGDAAMTWTDGTSEDGASFKEETISPAAIGGLKKSRLVGVSLGTPTETEAGAEGAHGALSHSTAGTASANTYVVLPKHRKTVKKYFGRGTE